MARMAGFGWGQYSAVSSDEAMAAAKAQEPRPLPEASAHHPDSGSMGDGYTLGYGSSARDWYARK